MLDRSDVGDVHQDSRDGGYDTEDGEESIFVHLLLMFGVDDTLFTQRYKKRTRKHVVHSLPSAPG